MGFFYIHEFLVQGHTHGNRTKKQIRIEEG